MSVPEVVLIVLAVIVAVALLGSFLMWALEALAAQFKD